MALYGITGACSLSFTSSTQNMAIERALASFDKKQAERYDIEGWHMVVLGDINAFTSAVWIVEAVSQ